MHIKPQTVIPSHVKIVRVPAAEGKAPSIFTLSRRRERVLEKQAEQQERFKQALAEGKSVVEAAVFALS